jgi:hypothetical protein
MVRPIIVGIVGLKCIYISRFRIMTYFFKFHIYLIKITFQVNDFFIDLVPKGLLGLLNVEFEGAPG